MAQIQDVLVCQASWLIQIKYEVVQMLTFSTDCPKHVSVSQYLDVEVICPSMCLALTTEALLLPPQ